MGDAALPIRGSQTRAWLAGGLGVVRAGAVGCAGASGRAQFGGHAALHLGLDLPPSATSMTVCYGFVCRRREILDFTAAIARR